MGSPGKSGSNAKMKVTVTVNPGSKKTALGFSNGATIKNAIEAVGANSQTIIVKLNGKIAHEKSALADGDKVELIGIIYGG